MSQFVAAFDLIINEGYSNLWKRLGDVAQDVAPEC